MNIPEREKAQSLVELALSLMFLLLLVAGVVDLGRAFFTYIALRDAAQEGAAYASIARTSQTAPMACAAIENRVRGTSNTPVNLQSSDISVTITLDGVPCASATNANACFGKAVVVTVSYANFPVTTPFLGTVLGTQTIPISASIIDTILTPPCD